MVYFIIVIFILLAILIGLILEVYKSTETETNIQTITLAEVTHSAFYAPLYVAIENGYFEDAGINIELTLVSGANNVTAAVLSGDVDIGFCGPEATIYVYNGNLEDYVVTFAGLTKRDGQFLVSREKIDNFDWNQLIGKEVLAGRQAGMPELNFENALANSGIDKNSVNINTSVDFASLTSAFLAGEGDFVNLFEPNATALENLGYGYVVASVGEASGELPYTAFNTKISFLEENRDLLVKFTDAIAKGLTFTEENDAQTIAEIILPQFSDTSLDDLTNIINRYKEADSWLKTPYIEEELFENLEDIMINSGEIDSYVPYQDLINNLYE